jgi:hypothetical protein
MPDRTSSYLRPLDTARSWPPLALVGNAGTAGQSR